jgi:hypothetical protein
MTDDVLKHSVTKDDVLAYAGGPVFHFMIPMTLPESLRVMTPEPPMYWTPERDLTLRGTLYREDMWASAVGIACTKMSSQAWEVESEIPLRTRRAQDLMTQAGMNKGWVNFITKHLQDYILTDNGAFVEIVRATTSLNSQIIGLITLDSLRCTRTGDPYIPVIYRDLKGRLHEMKSYQVIDLVDMPDPGEAWFGVGHCAASRAYHAIHREAAISNFIDEKVSGRRILAMYFVNAMNQTQINNAIASIQGQADAKGVVSYMGAVIVPVPGEKAPEVTAIPFAEIPDGIDRKEEHDINLLVYADAIGLDIQDLQPLTGQPLGTGAQSQVLDDKAKGKGLAAWRQAWTHAMTWSVLPDLTTFLFVEKDYKDQQAVANIKDMNATWLDRYVKNATITPAQALQVAVDANDLPKEFLPTDITPESNLSDSEKVDEETPQGDEENPTDAETDATTEAVKEISTSKLILAELPEAVRLFEEVTNAS